MVDALRLCFLLLAALTGLCSCGTAEEDPPPSSPPTEFEVIADRLEGSASRFIGRRVLEESGAIFEAGRVGPERRVEVGLRYGTALLWVGEVKKALSVLGTIEKMVRDDPLLAPFAVAVTRTVALAHLREAEVENCVRRMNADCCLFPLAGGGKHTVDAPARAALGAYVSLLEKTPQDLSLRWLANVAGMMLGDYPESVPEPFRLDPARFESDHDIGRFTNVAREAGVDAFNLCGGAILEDFDGDGHLDIVTSTHDPRGPLRFYRGQEGLEFTEATEQAGFLDQLGGLNCVAGDYDSDGDVDLLVLRGAWLKDDGQIRNSLLRNDGAGHFTDVTREAGLAEPACPTQAACWGDFNGDGHLDLYVVNESRREVGSPPGGDYPAQLFINSGDGIFTDVAKAAGVTNDRYGKGVCAGDYDNDGDLDLYVSNVGPNRLYRNDGNGSFTDVAVALGVQHPTGRSFATWFFDHDNDGWLDLFVGAYSASLSDVAADYMGRPQKGERPRLYKNGGGRFTEISREVGLDHPYLPMGASFGDLDNDGFLDIYLATGDPEYETLTPNAMLRNDRGVGFQDVTTSGGFGHLQKGHGVAFGDVDGDGDQDIYCQLGGFYPGDGFSNALFLNPGHGNGFVRLKLVGVQTNRSAVGARITLTIDKDGQTRRIHRAVGIVGSFGCGPLRQEIGIGSATVITKLEIEWPTSGRHQEFRDVVAGRGYIIREDSNVLGEER